METNKEWNWVIREHYYADSASGMQQSTQVKHSRPKTTCESSVSDKWEKRLYFPIEQREEASGRHVACDVQPDCITADTMTANMTMKSSPSPIGSEISTRSGQISCRLVRLGIGT